MADTTRTPLVDVHAHFLTEEYVQAAKNAGNIQPDGMAGWPTWHADQHLELMDQWGISNSILSISSPGVWFGDAHQSRTLARHVNDIAAETRRAHPDSAHTLTPYIRGGYPRAAGCCCRSEGRSWGLRRRRQRARW